MADAVKEKCVVVQHVNMKKRKTPGLPDVVLKEETLGCHSARPDNISS